MLVLGGSVPSSGHTVRAASMVLHHLVRELRRRGHAPALQLILSEDRRAFTEAEAAGLAELGAMGAEIWPAFFRSDYAPDAHSLSARARRLWVRTFRPRLHYFPAARLQPRLFERLRAFRPDVALIVWNTEGVAATHGLGLPRLAYHGMPDHAAPAARLEDAELFGLAMSEAELVRDRRRVRALESQHLALMLGCETVTNLSAEWAGYYARHGHPRSLYLQNLWPARPAPPAPRPPRADGRLRIIGSVGRPAATGNTYGLAYIARELLPRLDAAFGPEGYEVHVLGAGEAVPAVQALLERAPAVKRRGFVDDIDGEIHDADVFLVANNANRYRGSHTRFLHAWSLEACCVAVSPNALANPEMVHDENVLLGATPDELVTQIRRASTDPVLRRRIGQAGYRTYREHFTPDVVVGRLIEEMERLGGQRRAA